MAQWQGKSRRKPSGGRLISSRNKRKYEIGSESIFTLVGKENRKIYRHCGGQRKAKLMGAEVANVYNPDTKKSIKSKIVTVKENLANPHFVQRNIITKGAILQTELGMVRVTSRPGQDGVINGVLVKKKEE